MAANAPYYQMRAGQFISATDSTNAAPPQFVPEDDGYELSASATVASPLDHLHPSMYSEHAACQPSVDNTFEESHNLAELLEAATTARAAAQPTQTMDVNDVVVANTGRQGKGKRKQVSTPPPADAVVAHRADEVLSTKRRRVNAPTDPQLPACDRSMRSGSEHASVPPSNESLLNDARAAGVHSAAALFRHSSERISHKYTRPPMSKLFMSLQLSPENFLQLQAQAKAYMLDLSHPERQSCVGNRGKGDTDMVKLRLFNCVRDFLNDGVGEQFFGEQVEKPGEKEAIEAARALGEEKIPGAEHRLTWPGDGNKIISLVTPLMRRMVTNERQRQYAVETRKGGAKKKERDDSVEAAAAQQAISKSGHNDEQHLQSTFDPSLGHSSELSHPGSPSTPIDAMATLPGRYSNRTTLAKAEAMAPDPTRVKLPNEGPSSHNLSRLNIFLTLAPRGSRPSIKLDETRITAEPHKMHLAWYEWEDFLQEIVILLQRAKTKFPQVREALLAQESHHGAEILRGLAAAANDLSNENANRGDAAPGLASETAGESHRRTISQVAKELEPSASRDPSPSDPNDPAIPLIAPAPKDKQISNSNTDTEPKHWSRYVIKSIGPDGWRTIGNAKEWYDMLLEKSFAVWADGVCNVLVELVDVPAPAKLVKPPVQQIPKFAGDSSGKKKKKRLSLSGVVGMFKGS